ncbi:DoxX family protein [soil metagenome]
MKSKRSRWAGRIVSGLAAVFLTFDGAIKLSHVQSVADAHRQLGIPMHLAPAIGVIELACLALYLVPRSAVLGAVLLTGYLGGAVAIHMRLEDPLVSHTLFPIYVGVLCWVGLYLRDPRVRALVASSTATESDETIQPRVLRGLPDASW